MLGGLERPRAAQERPRATKKCAKSGKSGRRGANKAVFRKDMFLIKQKGKNVYQTVLITKSVLLHRFPFTAGSGFFDYLGLFFRCFFVLFFGVVFCSFFCRFGVPCWGIFGGQIGSKCVLFWIDFLCCFFVRFWVVLGCFWGAFGGRFWRPKSFKMRTCDFLIFIDFP